jgi:hypothetical protein
MCYGDVGLDAGPVEADFARVETLVEGGEVEAVQAVR